MQFGFSLEISEDIYGKGDIIIELSDKVEALMKDKFYGKGISSLVIGFICVRPEFDFFLKPEKNIAKLKNIWNMI